MALQTHNKRLLITGATGQQGGAVIRHTLARGWQVRALTRDRNKPAARALAERGVEMVEGDFDNPASLEKALEGVYGVFSVQTWEGTAEGIKDETRKGKLFADLASEAGVQHFVYSSVDGAERESGIPHFECKWPVEMHIQALGLPATILRPVFFMENFSLFFPATIKQGLITMDMRTDIPLQMIAVDDIGGFAALAFERPETFMGTTTALAGDELTLPHVAEVLSRVLGRSIRYMDVPTMWQGPDFLSQEFRTMFSWYNSSGYHANITAVRELYPSLMTLETWLRTTGWGQE